MVRYCEKILTEKFTDKQSKKCYMKAVKWLALNIVSKPELNGQVVYNITKSFADNKYTYTVEAYDAKSGVYSLRRLNLSLSLPESLIISPDERAHDMINRKQF